MAIIEENKKINGNIELRYLTLDEGRGFKCNPGVCGLCCILENPGGILRKTFKNIDRCSEFDLSKKICKSHSTRPFNCIKYPFIVGLSTDKILTVSPSFGCPFVSEEGEYGIDDFLSMLENDNSIQNLEEIFNEQHRYCLMLENHLLNPIYNDSKANAFFPCKPKGVLDVLRSLSKDYIDDPIGYFSSFDPTFTSKILELCDFTSESFKMKFIEDVAKINTPDIVNTIRVTSGSPNSPGFYIRPGLTPSIISYCSTGNKIKMKDILNDEETIMKMNDCIKSITLDPDAKMLLKDYINLFIERDYFIASNILSESDISISNIPGSCSNPLVSFRGFINGFIGLITIGVAIIPRFYNASTVSKEIMREIMSLSDSRLGMPS